MGKTNSQRFKTAKKDDTLRALMLVAIKDSTFESVRKNIIKEHTHMDANGILKIMREYNGASSMIRDDFAISGDKSDQSSCKVSFCNADSVSPSKNH